MTSQTSDTGSTSSWLSAVNRAEAAFENGGRQVGGFAATLREKRASVKAEAQDEAAASQPMLSLKSDALAASDRAELAVDDWGARIGSWTAEMGRRLQRVVAVAQEEAEDMVAEAQTLRGKAP